MSMNRLDPSCFYTSSRKRVPNTARNQSKKIEFCSFSFFDGVKRLGNVSGNDMNQSLHRYSIVKLFQLFSSIFDC